MSLGAARAAMFGAASTGVPPLPQGLAITSAAIVTNHHYAGYDLVRDSNGDVYVPSTFFDGVDANSNCAVTKYAADTMAVLWSKHIQSAAATANCNARGVLAVSDGVIVSSYHYITDKNVVAITKLAFDGTLVWTKHISDTSDIINPFVAEASNGDILVAAAGTAGLLVVKLTSAGAEVWKKDYTIVATLTAIVLDASDNIYIGLSVDDTVKYLGLVKLNSAGVLQANPRFNTATAYDATCSSISLSSAGDVYLAGAFSNSATGGDVDGCLVRLNSSLVLQWARKVKAAPTDQPDLLQAEVGPDGMLYLVGYTKDADAIQDGLLAKYDTAGVLQWKRSLVTGRGVSGVRPGIVVDGTNMSVLLYGQDTGSVNDTWVFTAPIDGTGLGTYDDAVYADATNVTDSEYVGIAQHATFGATEVVSNAVIGVGDETLLNSGLTSTFHTVV